MDKNLDVWIEQLKLLLTEREAAQALSVCPKTVFNLTKSGQLKSVRIGRSVRYHVDELRRFCASLQTQNAGAD